MKRYEMPSVSKDDRLNFFIRAGIISNIERVIEHPLREEVSRSRLDLKAIPYFDRILYTREPSKKDIRASNQILIELPSAIVDNLQQYKVRILQETNALLSKGISLRIYNFFHPNELIVKKNIVRFITELVHVSRYGKLNYNHYVSLLLRNDCRYILHSDQFVTKLKVISHYLHQQRFHKYHLLLMQKNKPLNPIKIVISVVLLIGFLASVIEKYKLSNGNDKSDETLFSLLPDEEKNLSSSIHKDIFDYILSTLGLILEVLFMSLLNAEFFLDCLNTIQTWSFQQISLFIRGVQNNHPGTISCPEEISFRENFHF